ncbi:general secretion pathway protein GspK [Pedobacter insulae]|uniref:Helix-hairpin-helix motif-containing protein n=1 Tax=Pedobacter insulae TaxID=414048 RepID=A0A1I2UJD3_9SPHI|nr:general secretion pathway protein GspK [Pedobacter insulae]SFG76449.1 hypothetical protein SAMN04489864_102162 [Pedobacter insulae]
MLSFTVKAQEDLLIKELLEDLAEDLPEDFDLSELTERLIFLRKHPINLNRTEADELKELFFLSPLQISNFCNYLSVNGKLIDVLELQAIDGFDSLTVRRILPFVQINEVDLKPRISLANLTSLGESDLVIRYARTLEKQKGFRNLTGSRYLGTPEKTLLRYKYNLFNRLMLSLVLEKDAGEKLIAKPTDFISANLTIHNLGIFKKLIVGDYSLQFGQGLSLWSGFGFGKGPDVTSAAKKDVGLKPYASANEYSFFRGLATKISLSKKLEATTFWSLRRHDAALKANTFLTTLNETGYHRTATELRNARTVTQQSYGLALTYQHRYLNLGAVLYQSHYSKTFITNDITYRLFNFTGERLTNFGFNYDYTYKNIYFFGEIAKSLKSGTALMNAMLISFSNQVSGVFLYRKYQKNYHNFFNQAPGESDGANENGFYTGLNISPSKQWLISLYTDYFKFPWLKFRIDAPSKGYETLVQAAYTPTKTFKARLRYKRELKQQNTSLTVPINYLEDVKKESFSIDVNWKLNKLIKLQNRLEVAHYRKGTAKSELGYLAYQDLAIAPINSKFTANLRLAYFTTPSYDSRLYAYEDDILYNFSFGMYHGSGFRSYVNVKYKLRKNIDMWLRYALFYYQHTTTIGAGLDEINGNKKTEVKLQLRYQF